MLTFRKNDSWTRWAGQPRPLDGEGSYQLPRAAETLYSDDDLAAYGLARVTSAEVPEGKIKTGFTIEDQGGVPIEVGVFEDAPPPAGDQIDAERERRIALPLEVTLSVGTITINMDPLSQRNLQGLASVGQYLTATGSTQTTAFRAYDNASHGLTPTDLVAMGLQVAQRIQAVYAASWAIKAMDPIPADYADDAWWT